jgi:hypothetical protein
LQVLAEGRRILRRIGAGRSDRIQLLTDLDLDAGNVIRALTGHQGA